jgi:hypothetical protein
MGKKPALQTPLSKESIETVNQLAKKLGYKGSAELVRALLRQTCIDNGLEWNDELDPVRQWGEHNRPTDN